MDFRPGDVVHLIEDLGEQLAGLWLVTHVDTEIIISPLGEDEEGRLCSESPQARVARDQAQVLIPLQFNIFDPLPA